VVQPANSSASSPGLQQEVRVVRPPVPGVALGERLVDHEAAGQDGRSEVRHERAVQVAEDQRRREPARSQRVAGASLEVHLPRLTGQSLGVELVRHAVERLLRVVREHDGQAHARQEEAVPAAAAGEVHDGSERRGFDQRAEMLVQQRRVH
jgi:hypothetical protein